MPTAQPNKIRVDPRSKKNLSNDIQPTSGQKTIRKTNAKINETMGLDDSKYFEPSSKDESRVQPVNNNGSYNSHRGVPKTNTNARETGFTEMRKRERTQTERGVIVRPKPQVENISQESGSNSDIERELEDPIEEKFGRSIRHKP